MLNTVYPAIFHEEDLKFWVEFPDLTGCQTYADNLEEAMELSSQALGLYLAHLIETNQSVPAPSDIKKINTSDGFASYIYSDVQQYFTKTKSIKKTLTIPEWLNIEAENRQINFSAALKKALLQEIDL